MQLENADRRPRREAAININSELAGRAEVTVTGAADIARRPCRYCHRTRPVVSIGSSRWWDTCARCARGLSNVQRRYGLDQDVNSHLDPIDPWAERIAEILAAAEAVAS